MQEIRFIRAGIVDNRIFDPTNFIFPSTPTSKKCEHLSKFKIPTKSIEELYTRLFQYAIMYLQLNTVDQCIYKGIWKRNFNPYCMISQIVYPYECNKAAWETLIKKLIQCFTDYDKYLFDRRYAHCHSKKIMSIIYPFLPIVEGHVCSLCSRTYPQHSLVQLCTSCPSLVHIKCYYDNFTLLKDHGECRCNVCFETLPVNEAHSLQVEDISIMSSGKIHSKKKMDMRVYFPRAHVYFSIHDKWLIYPMHFTRWEDRFRLAMYYLQVDWFKELLSNLEDPNVLYFLRHSNLYHCYDQTVLMEVCLGTFPTGYQISIQENKEPFRVLYQFLMDLGKRGFIDVEHKDVFGKSAWDYVANNPELLVLNF